MSFKFIKKCNFIKTFFTIFSISRILNSDIKMETEDFVEEDQNSAGLNNEWKINKVPIKSELDEENPNGNFNFDGEDINILGK